MEGGLYMQYIQGVTNKFRQNVTACTETQNKQFFMNNKMSKNASLPRYWCPDSRVTFKIHRVLI